MLPVNEKGKIMFVKNHGPELWATLIEKAWAKVHDNYDRIIGGKSYNALRDLTGAPSFIYEISETPDIFDIIKDSDEKNYIICAGCTSKKDANAADLKELGLMGEHAYAVIQAA